MNKQLLRFCLMFICVFCVMLNVFSAPPMVTDVTRTSTNYHGSHIVFRWTTPVSTFPLTNMDVRISTNPINTLNWARTERKELLNTPGAAGTQIIADINGLQKRTVYYLAVKVQDTTGAWSIMSPLTSGVTGGDTVGILLAWDPSPDATVTHYILHRGIGSGVYDWSTNVGASLVAEARLVLTNGNEAYYFVVTASTRDGVESGPSNELCLPLVE